MHVVRKVLCTPAGLLQYTGDRDEKIQQLRDALEPMRLTVDKHRFLGGTAPGIADLEVFSLFLARQRCALSPLLLHRCWCQQH